MLFKSCRPLHRGDEDSWPVRGVVVAFLAAERAVFPVKEHALANVRLHVTFGGLCVLAGAVAKRTIGIGDFNQALARTDRTFFDVSLSHPH